MTKIIEKHKLFIRWCHWVNFPILALMVWSGTLIYWANQIYLVIPRAAARALQIDHHLALGMGWHFLLMWIFAINGILFVGYLAISGAWRELWPGKGALRDAVLVTLHDLGVKAALPPQEKYNAAQRIAYTAVILMGAGSLLTGLAIYKPVQLSPLTRLLGGYEAARLEHFVLTVGYVFFFLIHVAQVARAGWNNFRGMVAGYELHE